MTALTRSTRGSANQLLYQVLEEPQLLAAVRELPAPVLVRLINHVGLEDAGELIALTSTEQLGEVFDAELWQSSEPGADETFRPERFALFLRLLYEAGEAFVVERLLALPRPFLTLAVHKLLLVVDIDALTVSYASSGRFYDDSIERVVRAIDNAQFEEWEEFRLIARDPNAFEDLWNALLALDREDHELVRDVIERCCDLDGELIEESGLFAVLNEEELLENDLANERSDRRAAHGFVKPADARAFLELARRETIDEAPDGRDPITRAYFRELVTDEPKTRSARSLPAANKRAAPADVGRLLAVLRDANVLDEAPVVPAKAASKALSGAAATTQKAARKKAGIVQQPKQAEPEAQSLTLMAAAMLVLRESHPSMHAQRSEELGFLANVLVAGSRHDGRTYRPVEAIECALAVCSVGLERAAASAPSKQAGTKRASTAQGARPPTAAEAAALLVDHSADRLFRAGLHALYTAVSERARACISLLLGINAADVPAAISGGSAALLAQLTLEADAALALAALAEPEPWLAGRLSTQEHLFLTSQRDLDRAAELLAEIEHQLPPS